MRRCCVPGCTSNYTKPYVSVFQFPKSAGFRNLWQKKIGCPHLKITENIGVCIKHFEKNCVVDYKEWKSEGNRKRTTVKHGAVPTIFELDVNYSSKGITDSDLDVITVEDSPEKTTNLDMPSSSSKFSPSSDATSKLNNSTVQKSPSNEGSPTTDKPFITVIKPESSRARKCLSFEEVEDNSFEYESPSSNSKANSAETSPYKNFPDVSVCLKEEDHINVQRELGKSIKRTISVSSNGSGNNESPKLQPKRRKIEKPAPTVLGKTNDCYCWVCHRENVTLTCIACPRAFHQKCAGNYVDMNDYKDWVCPECKRILQAENVDTQSTVLSEISLDKLCSLLKFSLNKMKHRAGVAFHQPVSLDHYPMYLHYIINPMDFSLLEKNIQKRLYGCTEAFLADVKWIMHNSCVFNGSQHPLSTNAKTIVKTCESDMQEVEVCPDCFMRSIVRNKYWFSEVCRKPHPLVWAKLKGFPYWPAKVVRIADGNIDARFFGAHDRAWVPVVQCYHLSKEMPTSSKPKKKGNYETALDELDVHVQLFIQKFGKFDYAPYRTVFDVNNKHLAYHGVDIDKIDKEEIPCDISTAEKNDVSSSSKDIENDSNENSAKEGDNFGEFRKQSLANSQFLKDNIPSSEVKNDTNGCLASEMNNKKHAEIPKQRDETTESTSDSTKYVSDSKKLEMVLQRIKGYISTADKNDVEKNPDDSENNEIKNYTEKENSNEGEKCKNNFSLEKENPKEEENCIEKDPKESSIAIKDDSKKREISFLSGLVKSKTLPPINIPTISIDDDSEKEKTPVLDVTKKNDSFSLKLIETIASCKAKLGISSELDKIDSDVSEDDDDEEEEEEEEDEEEEQEDEEYEEDEDEEQEEEEEEEEDNEMEKSSDKQKQSEKSVKRVNSSKEGSDSEEESHSHSSETDIEIINEEINSTIVNHVEKEASKNLESGLEINSTKEMEVKKVSDSENKEKCLERTNVLRETEKTLPEKENENKRQEEQFLNEDFAENGGNVVLQKQNENCTLEDKEIADSHLSVSKNCSNVIEADLTEKNILKHDEITLMDINIPESTISSNKESMEDGKMDEDDDIFICPPVKPPTPPLICLDDGTETEPECEENSESISPSKNQNLKSLSVEVSDKISSVFGIPKLPTSARKSMKRVFQTVSSEEESSDEELMIIPNNQRHPLTGAKRTFNNRDRNISLLTGMNNSSLGNISLNAVHPNEENTLKEQSISIDDSTGESNPNCIANSLSKDPLTSDKESTQNITSDSTNSVEDKDAEIVSLKKKITSLASALHLQRWRHNQEKTELRHNMNLIIMEMRASLEADKKQAIETLGLTFERQKQKCIDEAKKKQWCASCHQESRYACCWNTSYCTVICQKRHFPEHRNLCTQLRKLSVEGADKMKTSPSINDGKENKKVLVLNVVPQVDAANLSATHQKETIQQVSLSKLVSPKAPIHLNTSSSSAVQFLIAPVKADGSSTTSSPQLKPAVPKIDNSGVNVGQLQQLRPRFL